MSTFKYTEDGCVVDENGFIVAEYGYWKDAQTSCQQANEQIAEGEDQQTVERRLRDWAAQIDLETEADTRAAIHFDY